MVRDHTTISNDTKNMAGGNDHLCLEIFSTSLLDLGMIDDDCSMFGLEECCSRGNSSGQTYLNWN